MTIDTVLLFEDASEAYAGALARAWKNRSAMCCRVPAPGVQVSFGEHMLVAGVMASPRGDPAMLGRLADMVAARVGSSILISATGAPAPAQVAEADVPVIRVDGDPIADAERLDIALRDLDRNSTFGDYVKWRRSSLSRLRTSKDYEAAVVAAIAGRRKLQEEREEDEFVRRDALLARASSAQPAPAFNSARLMGYVVGVGLGCALLALAAWAVIAAVRAGHH